MSKKVVDIILTVGIIGSLICGIWFANNLYQLNETKERLNVSYAIGDFSGRDREQIEDEEKWEERVNGYVIQRNISLAILIVSVIILGSGLYLRSHNQGVSNEKLNVSETTSNSVALQDLKKMLNDDLISQDEFDEKKKEILSRI